MLRILILSVFVGICSIGVGQVQPDAINKENIMFIPREFNDVKLGFNETNIYPTTPNYPEPIFVMLNEIAINAPQKIIIQTNLKEIKPIIPICGYYVITSRRGLKYAEEKYLVSIKKVDDKEWVKGEIIERYEYDEYPALPPHYYEMEEERLQRIKEAQKYADSELNEGQASGSAFNLNIMEYLSCPFLQGKYEIFVSLSGLESNHVFVEIVFEK